MLLFSEKGLVFLAVPKTGTTSIESAMIDVADEPIGNFPKHIPARSFFRRWERRYPDSPRPNAFAVVRDPVDRLKSWYRYRQRSTLNGSEKSTAGVSFEEFVVEYLHDDPRPFAALGSQYQFCTDAAGNMLVNHLFCFDNLGVFEDFLRQEIEPSVRLPHLNASQSAQLELSDATMARLKAVNAAEFELYEQVVANGTKTFETASTAF